MISGARRCSSVSSLGNSSTLRGWNKYELDPLGGNRMVHNSVEYRYGVFQVSMTRGGMGHGEPPCCGIRSGLGCARAIFSLAVAFPLREGHIEPVFMVGMNY